MSKYRTEGSAVYVLDESKQAYVFAGWLNGRTLSKFIHDHKLEQERADEAAHQYAARVRQGGAK